MSIRAVPRRLATVTAAMTLVGTAGALAFGSPAFAQASPPSSGAQLIESALPLGAYYPDEPFASGQTIEVSVPANPDLVPGLGVNILECADPGGTVANLPTSIAQCDGNTIQGNTITANSDGSINYTNYQVYALPDQISLGEPSTNTPVCNTSNACVLYIGQDQNNFTEPHFFSQPFYVAANSTDDGSPQGDGGLSGTTIVAGQAVSLTEVLTTSPPSSTPVVAKATGKKPKGLSFTGNSNGTVTISGTVPAGDSGSYTFTLSETFGSGKTKETFTSSPITLVVDQPSTIKSPKVKGATQDKSYSLSIDSNKGSNPGPGAFYEIGKLPAGISLVDNGNGTAAVTSNGADVPCSDAPGNYPVTVGEWNAVGNSGELSGSTFDFTLVLASNSKCDSQLRHDSRKH